MTNSRREVIQPSSSNACSLEAHRHIVCSQDEQRSDTPLLLDGHINFQITNSPSGYEYASAQRFFNPTTTEQHGSRDYSHERGFGVEMHAAAACEPSTSLAVDNQLWQGYNARLDPTGSNFLYSLPVKAHDRYDNCIVPVNILNEQYILPSNDNAPRLETQGIIATASDQSRGNELSEATATADTNEQFDQSRLSEQGDDASQTLAQEIAAEPCYARLLRKCLKDVPDRTLALKSIYDWFMVNCKKAKYSKSMGWKNSIRHNLSMNPAFISVPNLENNRNEESHRWRLSEEAAQTDVFPTTRYRKAPKRRLFRGGEAGRVRAAAGRKGGEATSAAIKRRRRQDLLARSSPTIKTQPEESGSSIDAIPQPFVDISPGTDQYCRSSAMQWTSVLSSAAHRPHRHPASTCDIAASIFSSSPSTDSTSPTSIHSSFGPDPMVGRPAGIDAMVSGTFAGFDSHWPFLGQQSLWPLGDISTSEATTFQRECGNFSAYPSTVMPTMQFDDSSSPIQWPDSEDVGLKDTHWNIMGQ